MLSEISGLSDRGGITLYIVLQLDLAEYMHIEEVVIAQRGKTQQVERSVSQGVFQRVLFSFDHAALLFTREERH